MRRRVAALAAGAASAARPAKGAGVLLLILFSDFLHLGFLLHLLLHLAGFRGGLTGAKAGPMLRQGLERTGDGIGDGFCGKGCGAQRHAACLRGNLTCSGAHIACLDRLPAGAVGQNARKDGGRLLGRLKAAVDQHQLGQCVEDGRILKQNQLRTHDQGQEHQQKLHGDDCAEHGKRLHQKGGHPLLGLAAVIQRLRRNHGRRDQIEEKHIEDAGDTVENDHHHIENHRNGSNPDYDIVRGKADVKVSVNVIEVIDVLALTVVILPAQRVVKGGILVELRTSGRSEGTHQKDHSIQVGVIVLKGLARHDRNGARRGVIRQVFHGVADGTGNRVMIFINGHIRAQIA